MNCPICNGAIKHGKTSLTFEKEQDQILVVKNVPARICSQCGEYFINLSISKEVEKMIDFAEKNGVQMGFLKFTKAA